MTANETLRLVSQQWCTLSDLMKLANVGRNTALSIKKNIKDSLLDQGCYVPNNAVPMKEVVKYLNIDINYLESRINKIGG